MILYLVGVLFIRFVCSPYNMIISLLFASSSLIRFHLVHPTRRELYPP